MADKKEDRPEERREAVSGGHEPIGGYNFREPINPATGMTDAHARAIARIASIYDPQVVLTALAMAYNGIGESSEVFEVLAGLPQSAYTKHVIASRDGLISMAAILEESKDMASASLQRELATKVREVEYRTQAGDYGMSIDGDNGYDSDYEDQEDQEH